jgi:two-component sensor histidine kinase
MELMPAVWLVIGGLTIALLASFRAMAHELAAANERQRILFQVARQRVAQGAQPELGILETPAARLSPARAEAVKILADAARRIAGSPDMQSRLRNSASLRRELDAILRDAVTSIIDRRTVSLAFDVEELDLTFDLMSSITMLVIELANEAQKHVFQPGRGSCFSVALKAVPGDRATLTVTDDGPVKPATAGSTAPEERGLEIVHALVAQMHGTLRTRFVRGAEFAIEFPLGR